jgi:hypothetical protein
MAIKRKDSLVFLKLIQGKMAKYVHIPESFQSKMNISIFQPFYQAGK